MKDPSDLERVSSSVHRLTSFLTGENVGHNVFVTRGSAFEPAAASSSAVAADCLRVFVWARETLVGAKDAGEEGRKRQQQQQQ